jgi:hypothetical protein
MAQARLGDPGALWSSIDHDGVVCECGTELGSLLGLTVCRRLMPLQYWHVFQDLLDGGALDPVAIIGMILGVVGLTFWMAWRCIYFALCFTWRRVETVDRESRKLK